ncbi:AAA family ATPase [Pseudodesulfovibrio cashew]|uniref:AAA family ATPase n=1 Tax=Pseudodesulfovibrio cashew TaxID=2678688 RepID=A0A6I6JDZ4_9BACT|nr:AAA family ATPase [Pseudodesulfovibrio cashew]QGY39389.1 AAA family ATPase [Pseudodesulfovibrio cashew]
MTDRPVLYVFSGLPGTGKTTLARCLSRHLGACFLRIDTIEQGLRDLCGCDVQGEGYRLAYRIAQDNLLNGVSVVADCCNPIALTRDEWNDVAERADSDRVNLEITCSDPTRHRERVESRSSDIQGLALPTWEDVLARKYDPWEGDDVIRLDTACRSIEESLDALLSAIENRP